MTGLAEKTRIFFREKRGVVDVLLFGNELYLILSEKGGIGHDFEKIISRHVHEVTSDSLAQNDALRMDLQERAVSLLHSQLNFAAKILFTYSLEHLKTKDKVRFYYALKGRDGKSGILRETNSRQMGRAVILVNELHEQEFADFLALWKCPFSRMRILVEEKHA